MELLFKQNRYLFYKISHLNESINVRNSSQNPQVRQSAIQENKKLELEYLIRLYNVLNTIAGLRYINFAQKDAFHKSLGLQSIDMINIILNNTELIEILTPIIIQWDLDNLPAFQQLLSDKAANIKLGYQTFGAILAVGLITLGVGLVLVFATAFMVAAKICLIIGGGLFLQSPLAGIAVNAESLDYHNTIEELIQAVTECKQFYTSSQKSATTPMSETAQGNQDNLSITTNI
jgi:hypothetical protein